MIEHEGSGQDGNGNETSKPEKRFLIVVGVFISLGLIVLGSFGVYMLKQAISLGGTSTPPTEFTDTEVPVLDQAEATPQMPVSVGTESPNFEATATAACSLFIVQFPGTPCPAVAVPGIEATATAACAQFLSQFPGTPCP